MESLFASAEMQTRQSDEALFLGGGRDGTLEERIQHAVDAVASFEMWHRLREHQGLSKKSATQLVVTMLGELISGS